MRLARWIAAFGILMAVSGSALAGLCAQFTDVDSGNSLCPSVEWLKNRQITLGCQPGLYCPTDPVNRLAMAAFMKRLGTALEPAFVQSSTISQAGNVNAEAILCQTVAYDVSFYPRVATVTAMLYHAAPTAQTVTARIAYSTDGGLTWQNLPFPSIPTLATNVANGYVTQFPIGAPLLLSVLQSVSFGIQTAGLGGAPSTSDAGCSITVRIDNHNGTSSPF
jgi:hypothetical protein